MDLRNMAKGQTFEGTVMAVKGKTVTIESEGNILKARMEQSVPVSVGEKISFVVRQNQENRIEIAPLRMGSISMEELVVYKALETAGLKADKDNITIVKGLMKYQMPVSRDSIFHVLGLKTKYPDLIVEDILLMMRISRHVKGGNIYLYRKDTEEINKNRKQKKFVIELQTEHLGRVCLFVQWKENKIRKPENLYLLIQAETERINMFLQEQESLWTNRLREKEIACRIEYGDLKYKTEMLVLEFFHCSDADIIKGKDLKEQGSLWIQKFSLQEFAS